MGRSNNAEGCIESNITADNQAASSHPLQPVGTAAVQNYRWDSIQRLVGELLNKIQTEDPNFPSENGEFFARRIALEILVGAHNATNIEEAIKLYCFGAAILEAAPIIEKATTRSSEEGDNFVGLDSIQTVDLKLRMVALFKERIRRKPLADAIEFSDALCGVLYHMGRPNRSVISQDLREYASNAVQVEALRFGLGAERLVGARDDPAREQICYFLESILFNMSTIFEDLPTL